MRRDGEGGGLENGWAETEGREWEEGMKGGGNEGSEREKKGAPKRRVQGGKQGGIESTGGRYTEKEEIPRSGGGEKD